MKVCYTNYAKHKGREAALNDKMIRKTQNYNNYSLKDWSITPSLSASDRMSVQDKGLTLSFSITTYIYMAVKQHTYAIRTFSVFPSRKKKGMFK